MRLKISARSSHLARLQAYQVGEALQSAFGDAEIEYFFRESLGDKNLTDPLWKMPEKGVFTEDFYQDLVQEKTDLVVHSWKDLPTERRDDTVICGTLPRADQRDLLLFKKSSLKRLEANKAVQIFSSSQRRIYNLEKFLLKALPYQPTKIHFKDVRGNIPTRIEKLLNADDIDGLILAKAAIDRLLSIKHPDFVELQQRFRNALEQLQFMVLPLSENPNAAAQGALAIEIKKGRADIAKIIEKINDPKTFASVQKERDVLASYGGGCHQKIGIAVLNRDYGQVHFLKGLTDQNQILDQQKLEFASDQKPPKLSSRKFSLQSVKGLFERSQIQADIPKDVDAFLISRVYAYRPVNGLVWAAGIETWKKLAEQNVWVNGCAESLGEQESPRIETIVGRSLKWAKLTHKDADATQMQAIATYELRMKLDLPEEALQAENFFWMSAYQFDLVTAKYPQLLTRTHCCGVGQTYQSLTRRLKRLGSSRPYLFLNEAHWKDHTE
jgi:hydroxymethylbilane synthase